MSIAIDDAKFHRIVSGVVGDTCIEPRDVAPIAYVMQLAAGIDLDDDRDERSLVRTLSAQLAAFGNLPIRPLSPLPIDDEERAARIAELVPQLTTRAARELAFVLAYLVIVVDLELAPVESSLLEQLREALAISPQRADELTETAAQLVTPREVEEHPVAP